MIRVMVGRPGSGKTYAMVHDVLRAMRRNGQRPLWSTTPVQVPGRVMVRLPARRLTDGEVDELTTHAGELVVVMTRAEQLPDAPRGSLIAVDEAHVWFDSRDAMRIPAELRAQLSETRHAVWDLILTTQDFGQVDKRFRTVANDVEVWGAWFTGGKQAGHVRGSRACDCGCHPKWFRGRTYDPATVGKKEAVRTDGRFLRFDPEVAAAYSTRFFVRPRGRAADQLEQDGIRVMRAVDERASA